VTIGSIVAAVNKDPSPDAARHAELTVEDVELPEELVWSEPVSKLLKVGTARAHQDAETSAGAEALVKGQLELEEYIRWNAILWRVYK
jgi:heme oxygenase